MIKIVIALSIMVGLFGCGKSSSKLPSSLKTYVVKSQNIHKTLYFTGIIQPLRENTLTNPIDAVIETMHVHYGQEVKKGDILFTLNSTELQKQYNETLTDYLKAKDNHNVAQVKFNGTEELWKAGLMSKNNYLSEKSALNNSRVTLMQATHKLSEMLEKMGDDTYKNLSSLSFAKFDKVRSALSSKHNLIYLKAPNDGVVLYPPKSNDDKTGRVTVGATVKSGQVLALIGDLSGISVEIDIPEVDIDKIQTGMQANIHSVAFPKEVLQGKVIAINAQASTSATGALPSFMAIVEVRHLTQKQKSWVKVGMSAAIELAADSNNKLVVPITAVLQQDGHSVVKLLDKNGSISLQPILTGTAFAGEVVVDAGLHVGDRVLYG